MYFNRGREEIENIGHIVFKISTRKTVEPTHLKCFLRINVPHFNDVEVVLQLNTKQLSTSKMLQNQSWLAIQTEYLLRFNTGKETK